MACLLAVLLSQLEKLVPCAALPARHSFHDLCHRSLNLKMKHSYCWWEVWLVYACPRIPNPQVFLVISGVQKSRQEPIKCHGGHGSSLLCHESRWWLTRYNILIFSVSLNRQPSQLLQHQTLCWHDTLILTANKPRKHQSEQSFTKKPVANVVNIYYTQQSCVKTYHNDIIRTRTTGWFLRFQVPSRELTCPTNATGNSSFPTAFGQDTLVRTRASCYITILQGTVRRGFRTVQLRNFRHKPKDSQGHPHWNWCANCFADLHGTDAPYKFSIPNLASFPLSNTYML